MNSGTFQRVLVNQAPRTPVARVDWLEQGHFGGFGGMK